MRHSVISVVFAVALFIECYAMSVAMPMSKTEDSSLEQEALGSLLTEEAAESTLGGSDPAILGGKNGGTKVIVVADASLWRNLRALDRAGLSLYKQRAGENSLTLDRRDVGQDPSMNIIRRDTMRCMVGRVYRPCWEV